MEKSGNNSHKKAQKKATSCQGAKNAKVIEETTDEEEKRSHAEPQSRGGGRGFLTTD